MKQRLLKIWKAITQRGPIGYVRALHNIVTTYHANMQIIAAHVDEMGKVVADVERYVKKATKVHVDITAMANEASTVIVCGQYKGRDYVRVFPVRHGSLDELVEWLTNMSRHAQIGRLDMAPQFDASVRRVLSDNGAI